MQPQTAQNVLTLTAAMIGQQPVTLLYTDKSGVSSIRYAIPHTIERCKLGHTIVRVYDLARKAPRTFCLDGIQTVRTGLRVVAVSL